MRPVAAPALLALALAACGDPTGGSDDDVTATDAAATDVAIGDAPATDGGAIDAALGDGAVIDAVVVVDAPLVDAPVIDAPVVDAPLVDATLVDAPSGPITGGPCSSGAQGATAYRIRWANGGGSAYVVYEVHAMPDTSRFRAGAYGYSIGFTPQYVDTALAQGGLLLNSSSFVDIELSTVGISSIASAHLAIYGRSYNTTASGSFDWQTFDGIGAAPTNFVANSAPYEWYAADMTTEIAPGDDRVLVRIKAGPSSGSLAVNRIEICMQAT